MNKNRRIRKIITLFLCLAIGMAGLIFSACGARKEEKPIFIYADSALQTVLPLVGEKFNVLNEKNYELVYVFESAEDIKNDVFSGKICDVILTDSSALLDELAGKEKIDKEKCPVVAGNRLVLVSKMNMNSLSDIFRVPEYDEENGEYVEIEGFLSVENLLLEEYWEAEWDGEERPPLMIPESLSKIAICGPQSIEGQKSKELVNSYFQYREPVDRYDLLLYCNNDKEVIEAVSSGKAQAGICLASAVDETMPALTKSVLTDKVINYSAALIKDCLHKESADLFIKFLPGKEAKRFFDDFNFN